MHNRGILFDFDDTLVETTMFFEIARERFARFMEGQGFPLPQVLEVLDRKDVENVCRLGGFMKECFPAAMAETYRHFCGEFGIPPDPSRELMAENMGWWVFDQKPVLMPGSARVLEELAGHGYRLFLATKGDPSLQRRRIDESGIRGYFEEIYVLKDKTSREYSTIGMRHGLDPPQSWVVGNSFRSDINPAISAGFNCIYIPNRYTWHYEMEDPRGDYHYLETLDQVPQLVIKQKCAGERPAAAQ